MSGQGADEPRHRSGDVARRLGISYRALVWWTEKGILRAEQVSPRDGRPADGQGSVRLYREGEVRRGEAAKVLLEAGLPLPLVVALLDEDDPAWGARALADRVLQAAEEIDRRRKLPEVLERRGTSSVDSSSRTEPADAKELRT